MINVPVFESAFIIGDDACLAAEVSSFFNRARHYVPVSDGPRMTRPDWSNEVISRRNSIVKARPAKLLVTGLSEQASAAVTAALPAGSFASVHDRAQAAAELRGIARPSDRELHWPSSNLGIGLMLARQSKSTLIIERDADQRPERFVAGGRHALVVCESDEEISHVIAANLASSIGASFLVMPEVAKKVRRDWIEEMYVFGSPEARRSLTEIADDMRASLPAEVTAAGYTEIIFITSDLPWGLAVPECPSSHLYHYPDLGRIISDGIWCANRPRYSARTALLVDPGEVRANDIDVVEAALRRNNTLVRVARGARANVHGMDIASRIVPFDVIVIATHAGEWKGSRATYRYPDAEGRERTLVVDEAVGIGYDPSTDMFPVQFFYSFRSIDGVSWDDEEAKRLLPVGSAISTWVNLPTEERRKHLVDQNPIQRVRGAMALKMSDHIWLLSGHYLAAPAHPVVLNNACSSFHALTLHFLLGGARVYIGAVIPITNAEALEVAQGLFERRFGDQLATALWATQREIYGDQARRPYVHFGLPFARLSRNTIDSTEYLRRELSVSRDEFDEKARKHEDEGVRRNSQVARDHLVREIEALERQFPKHQ